MIAAAILVGYAATVGLFLVGWHRWQVRMDRMDKDMEQAFIKSTPRHF